MKYPSLYDRIFSHYLIDQSAETLKTYKRILKDQQTLIHDVINIKANLKLIDRELSLLTRNNPDLTRSRIETLKQDRKNLMKKLEGFREVLKKC